MATFTREIKNPVLFFVYWDKNPFLQRVERGLLQKGKGLLTIRDNHATVYYNGNRLCDLPASDRFDPKVNRKFLPLLRSKCMDDKLPTQYIGESEWRRQAGLSACTEYTYADVLPEICSNIIYHETPESGQIVNLYAYAPLCATNRSPVILLDIEAVFSSPDEDEDRIDLVLYHVEDRRLIFCEVKRLWDFRLNQNALYPAGILGQMERYQARIDRERDNIRVQYDRVIDFYNIFSTRHGSSGRKIPHIGEEAPLLGVLIVEYKNNEADSRRRKEVKAMLSAAGIKYKDIGDTSHITESSLLDIYKKFQ